MRHHQPASDPQLHRNQDDHTRSGSLSANSRSTSARCLPAPGRTDSNLIAKLAATQQQGITMRKSNVPKTGTTRRTTRKENRTKRPLTFGPTHSRIEAPAEQGESRLQHLLPVTYQHRASSRPYRLAQLPQLRGYVRVISDT